MGTELYSMPLASPKAISLAQRDKPVHGLAKRATERQRRSGLARQKLGPVKL
jgi:hypothetical protein